MPPRIVTARSMGLQFIARKLVPMGPETAVVGHSSRARARNLAAGIVRVRADHREHQLNRGWAGIGYHYLITDDGVIIGCRSTAHRGAHVTQQNAGRIGVQTPGTLAARDRPTLRQARAFNWLLHNAHTDAMPRAHRTDVDLSQVPRFSHKDIVATSCPGLFHGMYLKGGEPWVEPSGDTDEPTDEGFLDLTPEDEQVLADIDRGAVPHGGAQAFGADDEERDAPADPNDLELPDADDEFDEDRSDVLAAIEREQPQA